MKLPIFGIMLLVLALFAGAEMTDGTITESGLPGDLIEGGFTITNDYGANVTDVTFEASFDPTMSAVVEFTPSDIPMFLIGDSEDVDFDFTIPQDQAAGSYVLTVTASYDDGSRDNYLAQESYTFNFAVESENEELTLDQESGTVSVEQGESATFTILVTNSGNVDLTDIDLSYSQSDFEDYDNNQVLLTFGSDLFDLAVGQSRSVLVTVASHEDQYLGELVGNINVDSAEGASVDYTLTVETITTLIEVDLDDSEVDLDELEPGDDFEFDIEVDANEDLEDIQIKVWVVDIDDDGDLTATGDKFDLDGDSDSETFEFEVPYNVDEDTYDIRARIKGEIKDSGDRFEYYIVYSDAVEVVKDEDEEVVFTNIDVTPSNSLTCGSIFTATSTIVNIGDDELKDMYVEFTIDDLDLEFESEVFDLDESRYNDREYDLQFTVALPSNLDKNSYNVRFTAYNDDNDEIKNAKHYTFNVNTCELSSDDDEDVVDEEEQEVTQGGGNVVYLPTGFSIGDFFNNDGSKTLFWVLGNIALLIVIVYFIVLISRRKRPA